ncbi:hypothetical protein ANRL3_00852 [Anaerolineae bacterium]|nr:hypothetical protein ANRL3_00852 [Anaerolineae bacterium]
MEVIEVKHWAEVPDPVYPPEHPRSIMDRVIVNEKSSTAKIFASLWFSGDDPFEISGYSQTTNNKYRNILLKYGIDLILKPTDEMRKLWVESHPRNRAIASSQRLHSQ